MNRQELERYIAEEYDVEPEYLWADDNVTAVFRHSNNRKWFGVLMKIPIEKLGLKAAGDIDILDIKLEPEMVSEMVASHNNQIFPAYHMNKKHWVTIALNENIDSSLIKALLNESFRLTFS